MKYPWLLFDADGTLFDYDRGEVEALESTFQDYRLIFSPSAAEIYRDINYRIWLDFESGRISSLELRTQRFALLFEALGVQADVPSFSERYLYHLSRSTRLVDGAETLIRSLVGAHHLALITNGLKNVQRPRLAGSRINGLFDVVAISEEIGAAKPDPRFFDVTFEAMGNPPRGHALVIGDSLSSDILGGNRYGLDTCWFNPHARPADPAIPATYEIRDLSGLLPLLETPSRAS